MLSYLMVIASAVIFGITPTIQKELMLSGLTVNSLLMFNGILLTGSSFLRTRIRKQSIRIQRNKMHACMLAGVLGNLLTGLFMNLAFVYLPVGVVTMLNFLYPTLVTVFMFVLFGQKIDKLKIAAIVCSMAGMSFLVSLKGEMNSTGIIFGILSAFTYGAYFIMNEKSGIGDVPFETRHFYSVLPCPFVFTALALHEGVITVPHTAKQIILLLSIVALFLAGTSFLMKGIEKTGAVSASFISLIEPVVSVACGIIFLNEKLTSKIIAGGVMIFISMLLTTVSDAKGE